MASKSFGRLHGTPNPPQRSKSSRRPSATPSGTSSLGASIYASTVLSLEAEEDIDEVQPLNDQQWVNTFSHCEYKFEIKIIKAL